MTNRRSVTTPWQETSFRRRQITTCILLDWSEPNEWVGWKVRVNEPATYEISVKYTTASAANNGTYSISFGDQAFPVSVVPTASEPQATTATVGTVRLEPGEYEIQVKPSDIRGGELMRLFNISLTPK